MESSPACPHIAPGLAFSQGGPQGHPGVSLQLKPGLSLNASPPQSAFAMLSPLMALRSAGGPSSCPTHCSPHPALPPGPWQWQDRTGLSSFQKWKRNQGQPHHPQLRHEKGILFPLGILAPKSLHISSIPRTTVRGRAGHLQLSGRHPPAVAFLRPVAACQAWSRRQMAA